MADELTDRQREVLELFVVAAREFHAAPTYRDVCEALDFTSTNAASSHCKALIKKGWLDREGKNLARSLMLTDHARRIYGLPARGKAA